MGCGEQTAAHTRLGADFSFQKTAGCLWLTSHLFDPETPCVVVWCPTIEDAYCRCTRRRSHKKQNKKKEFSRVSRLLFVSLDHLLRIFCSPLLKPTTSEISVSFPRFVPTDQSLMVLPVHAVEVHTHHAGAKFTRIIERCWGGRAGKRLLSHIPPLTHHTSIKSLTEPPLKLNSRRLFSVQFWRDLAWLFPLAS